jgi:hypothetical protein
MPRIYAIFAAQRLYLRRAADGTLEFTTEYAEADDIHIETPYDEAPLTLAEAAAKASPVVLLFPDGEASTGESPLHPKDNRIAGGNTLAASRAASQIGRRWTVRSAPITEAEGDGFYICLSIAADHTLSVAADTTDAPGYRPILAGPDTVLGGRAPRIFYEDEAAEADHDYCESCDKPVEKDERWCCHGCRCDVEPGYERSFGR